MITRHVILRGNHMPDEIMGMENIPAPIADPEVIIMPGRADRLLCIVDLVTRI